MNTVVWGSCPGGPEEGAPEIAAPVAELALTYGQRALWFLDRMAPGNPAYVIAGAAHVVGELDVAALRRAAAALVARHPALRTTFEEGPQGPRQRVAAPGVGAVDFREEIVTDPVERADPRPLLAALAFAPFDLERGPLLRLAVLHLGGEAGAGPGKTALALSIHHIVADFWSLALLLKDLAALYALEVGEASAAPLPPPTGDYAAVVQQEEALLSGPEGDRLWEYWRSALAAAPRVLELPTDRPRPPVQTYDAGSCALRLPGETVAALRRLTRQRGATLYMGLLAGFELLLARYTGQEKLVVGSPTTGRVTPELSGVVGYLVNPVPIALDLAGDPTGEEILGRTREAARAAFAHQGYPFALLAERLLPERDPSRSPLFQAAMVLQKGRRSGEGEIAALAVGEDGVRLGFGPLALASLALPEPGVQFDLSVMLAESEPGTARKAGDAGKAGNAGNAGNAGIVGRWQYNRDLFDPPTAERMAGHFANLLVALATPGALDRRAADLPLLAPPECHQLLAEGNDVPGERLTPALAPCRFAAQAVRTPDAVALVCGAREGQAVTYGELDRRSALLARRLRGLGVGLESRVGLCCERSPELVVGLLGIWRAGGAYLPLDPGLPAARLSFYIEDGLGDAGEGAAAVLVTQKVLRERLAGLPLAGLTVVEIDSEDGAGDAGEEYAPLPDFGDPAALAYLIYTSGSTGQPKAVAVAQGNLGHALAAFDAAFGFVAGDRMPCLAPASFDIFLFELLGPLLNGGTVVLFELRPALDIPALVAALPGTSLLHAVPALMRQLVDGVARAAEACRSLRRVFVGGDSVPTDLLVDLGRVFPAARTTVLYGPTEGTIVVAAWAAWEVERALPADRRPLGRPLPGAILEVRDSGGRLVPVGVPGEIWIGGSGVARGYLGRPERTAERFVPGGAGGRRYRTGDLARRLPDGRLDFVGRTDHQAKVRGFRIELGEVEAVLAGHPGVRAAVVLVREEKPGDLRLAAYVVGRESAAPADLLADLRAWLRERLPDYMVPGGIALLGALPLSPNGKVDRKALERIRPAGPEAERVGAEAGSPAERVPSSPTEEILAGIWAEVLGIARVGVRDDFFALGGHSLLATQVVSRVREALGVELPLARLFAAPTVAALAGEVEAARARKAGIPPLRRREAGEREEGPLSFAQERLWFLDRLEPGTATYNLPGALWLRGPLDPAALAAALTAIVRRHAALRTTFHAEGGRAVQRIGSATAAAVAVPAVDLAGIPMPQREAETRRLARAEAARPFDLARGPLLRATLLRLGPAEHQALLSLHHIVADGWSVGVLVRELAGLYAAGVEGHSPALPELPVDYADFAAWQRDWLSGEVLEREIAYWRQALAGLAPLDLPDDRPRSAGRAARSGGWHRFTLPPALVGGLARRSREEGATLFMVLFAGFAALLARITGREDLAVGTAVANRTQKGIEGLIGFFVNTLVLRADLAGDPGAAELIGRLRAVCLAAYAHQDLPFEKVVEALAPDREAGRTPLFQVMLALQNAPTESLRLPGLSLEILATEGGTAKFDLVLNLEETPGGLAATFEYSRDRFEPSTIVRLAGHLENLLARVAEIGEARLSELPLLSAGERGQLLVEWNATGVEHERDRPVHERVAAQVRRAPDAVAVVAPAGALTYGELGSRADRWAARLRRLGVREETPVALCAGRSAELIVGALAVLRAGGSYVPLDPGYPPERLAYLLADLGQPLVLSRRADLARLPEGISPLLLEEERGEGTACGEGFAVGPGGRAYIIYTSGSTGRPKGVEVEHGSLANLVAWHLRTYGLTPADRATLVAGTAFDASVWEIWPVLAAGASLVIPEEAVRSAPDRLAGWLSEREITVSFLPTPLAAAVLGAWPGWEPTGPGPALRALLTGGDRLHRAPERDPGFGLYNHYGPTESTVVATRGRVEAGVSGLPAIGTPIDNTRVYLLDPWGQPVPLGSGGEVALGGLGLARGYWGQPERTAERFVPDPFAGSPGGRLYRTGDLARFRIAGALSFLGRIDDQVKVRGVRIEPGEIEAVLAAHPEVREAAVGLVGGERLVAYVVAGVPGPELRRYLAARLPEAMVPSAFVLLPALPLTPNGKVDRRALAGIEPEIGGAGGAGKMPPRTATEVLLAGIWSGVLGIEGMAVDDDFFALGGHSLLATQVTSRVREIFDIELPLRLLFEAPTLAALAREIDGRRVHGGGMSRLPAPPLRPYARTGSSALSFAQERLWFLDQLSPGVATYNVPVALRLRGGLSPAAFAGSLGEVVRRQEALRTTFFATGGQPAQRIGPASPVEIPQVDLTRLPAATRDDEGLRLARVEGSRPFDLTHGPLLRAALVRLGPAEHLALLNVHHIVADGWSMGVLVREMGALYGAHLAGPSALSPALPELPVQYADFALWQREWLSGEVLEAEIAYWRGAIAGIPRTLDLPTDRPRPTAPTYRGRHLAVALPPPFARALGVFSRESGATPFMVLLAGFEALLYRWSGQENFLVGTAVANRTLQELEGLIGFFVNTLALPAGLAGELSFGELVGRARDTALAAYAHQDLPLEKLVEAVEPRRDLSRAPLFQVLFALQNTPAEPLALPRLWIEPIEVEWGTAKFDLTLSLEETPEGFGGYLEYATDLFDGTTARRLLDHFGNLLADALAHPERPVSRLALLGEAERQQLLGEWSGGPTPYPRQSTIHGLFAEQAGRRPDAVAVAGAAEGGEECLSYGELDRRAGRLAHRLRALGVQAESRVGLLLERSPERLVATLAILQAGGCYLPLDPAYPRDRLALLLADGGPAVLVTEAGLLPLLPELPVPAPQILCIDREIPASGADVLDHASEETAAESLAYVMYTSGSTGVPKGVAVPHRGVVRLVSATAYADFSPGEVFFQLAPYAFDASTFEIWGALLHGARLVLPPPGALSLQELGDLLARHGVTTLWLTAGLFHQMVEENLAGLAGVRQLLAGGDVLSVPHVRRVVDELPGMRLLNGYGPTEGTTFTCCFACCFAMSPAIGAPGVSVPLGRPIANTWVHVVDRELAPVPIGVPGELWVGGDGLARGYLDRPGATAERFVPDPFRCGERLYRTGDLARFRADGRLEFLRRLDSQVKVRGFRVEPGEVEAALLGHPGVLRAVVVARDGGPGGKRLVAYLVGAPGEVLSPTELRGYLRERLPEPLVPGIFVVLPELPLSVHGKVDRRALPEPPVGDPGETERASLTPPSGPVEEGLAGIWADLLEVEPPGREDNFFELGGHSLLATRVVSRVREAFGVDLPLRLLFAAPTLSALAREIEALRFARESVAGVTVSTIRRAERERWRGGFPLSFAQERLWFLDQLDPGSPAYNVPGVLRIAGRLDVAALRAALREVVRRQEALRTTFAETGGQPTQKIAPASDLPIAVADLAALSETDRAGEARRLAGAEAGRGFDLTRGPLLRGTLLRLAPAEHWILLTMHHIVSDGWSVGVLVREVGALYASPKVLPELPIQYADFAVWQRHWLSGDMLASQLAFWRQALAGSPTLDLPTDRPRPPVQTSRGGFVRFALGASLSHQLAAFSRAEGSTLFMTLLTAFAGLLSRYAGQSDVAVGSPLANRTRSEIEGLIGFFVNTLVLRADLSGDPSFRQALARVRQRSLAAFSHQDLPFEKVVEELAPQRDPSRTPLFQVMFVLQNTPMGELVLPGLRFEPVEMAGERAKFDLTLSCRETAAGLALGIEYNRDLFEATTVRRLAGHLTILLEAVAAAPDTRLSDLPLLTPPERAQLLREWSRGAGDPSGPGVLHDLISARAALQPDTVALVSDIAKEGHLSHAELHRRSRVLAATLQSSGAGPESIVGIYAERSPEMVIGLLGILQAGAAYLPLDPSLPDERLAWMLDDGNAHLVLTQGDLQLPPALLRGGRSEVRLNGRSGRQGLARTERSFCLSPKGEFEHRPQPDPAVPLRPHPGNPAYVIYTSGSTGLPKGVMISHEAIAERLRYSTRDELLPGERIVHKATIGFDVSVFEIFGTLAAGGRLILAKPGGQQDADYLVDLLTRHEATYVSLPPVLLSALLERGGFRELASLRDVLTGGESVPADLPGRFHAALPCDLLNRYGPTETTISVTSWRFAREGGERPVPIGRPIAAAEVYLLDRDLHPVPVGVVGELYVGGVHLARGYLGSPELTAERFVPDPVGGTPGLYAGGRLYRSGDLARYQADGAIEFAGRVDHQVKIRGFRVELGEIEAALAIHPEVREAIVADRADPLGSRRLVAYVIPGGEVGPALVPVLRAHLEARLPSYMVPAAFVLLAAFPLSPSGKVDRRALPEPAPEGAPYLAPRTPAEEVVAGLFADLLKQERVGARDDFFALGGHSLLATRLASRLRQAFDVELPLRQLFERPTVAGLASAIEELRAEGATPAPPLLPARLDGAAPLSFAQERLWFLDQLDPGSAAYHMPGAFRLRGALDVPALRASLGEIAHRHAALRTIFVAPEGQAPVQVVTEWTEPALPLADLAGLPAGAREVEGRRLAGEEAVRPFDLLRGPLFRAGLIRLGPNEHLALVTMHHIVSDGWSMGVLVGELGALYPAFVAGLKSPLPVLPVQYADFAVWQRGWLSGEILASQIAYWRQSLAGLPPLDLPTDRPRPARRLGRGAIRSFGLPEELRQSLARFSREEGATLFMTLLAGLSALFSRSTGQDDLAVGSPIAGRTRAEVEGLIGFFVNTLVLRADLAGAPGFRALVARTRERTLAAFSHQDLPFEKVVEAVAPERDTRRTPLFQVFFVLQNAPAGRLELPGLTLEPLALDWEAAKFDLTLTLAETGSGLAGSWEYDRDLFDAPTILRLAGHFERLLAGMVARPDLAIAEAPILGEPEREQVRVQWNDLPLPQILAEAEGSCLHERIALQAERRPEAVALVWNEERLTYGALLARSHRLAQRLRDLGVGPEVRVGVCARRTPDLVAALLGVLAAGGAYVPLDPEYPRERLSFMLADSGASLVIAGGDVADRLPAGEVRILDLGKMLATGPPPLGETGAVPGNLAYLIYTSGSTGRPKGVAIEHRSAVGLIDWAARAFTSEELDGVLAATSVCFDLSVFEIFVPLALGGRVVLAANALALPDLPGAWEVTLVNTVPAAMRELVRGGRLPGSVRTVNLAGEPLPRVLAEAVHAAGASRLLNLYGPSEDTTYSTIEEVAAGEPGEPRIGRPLPGSQGYGVDRAGQLAPMGVAAELQLGGAGLARGYLGRPALTAERFVPDAWSGEPGARLYRTGDLVRSRPDGRWGFLGRIDQQVKVRGFRIELGEIEAALLAVPGVREAVVLARRDTPGASEMPEDARLVAYVVGLEEGDLSGPLRSRLAERLPEPMIPAAFVGLSALPRTPNGKLDRKALPAPEWKAGTEYLAPRTTVEEVLAGLFAEILGVSRVGVEDSFFRLGGHSLLATQLVSRVQGTFRVKLALRRLFETPTVAALAAAVLAGEEKAGQSEKIARALLRLRGARPQP